ncbi:MAG: exodeoxyribonuclease VII small subunit [Candidatus Eremiobacteraeota bacterium]|nr:exodeoxyribonuclease VII small subunit [Candidatus Eremiobacteraeota bacterium]
MNNDASNSFESKLARIDAIVKELETNQVPLDRAIELFKEGKTLARECETMLQRAQEQVDKAMSEPSGPA